MEREAELRLVEGLRRGEASAFDAIYEEYRPRLFSFVLRMVGRRETAVTALPARYREVLLLVGVEGMTPAAAAGVCGLSPEAMRKRLERARDTLAARLGRPRPRGGLW